MTEDDCKAGWPQLPPRYVYRFDKEAMRYWVGYRDIKMARLALLTGIKETTLYGWLRNGSSRMTADALMRLSDALEVFPSALMTREAKGDGQQEDTHPGDR